ncbi:MAG: OmpA family protein [Gammaproteobacteria bacterium]
MKHKIGVVGLVWLFLIMSVSAFGQSGHKTTVKGMINARVGDTLIVRSESKNVAVVVTDDTKIKDKTGLFGWGERILNDTVLIPGLKVTVKGRYNDEGRIMAKTIITDGDDLETAEMIQAGVHPTAQQVEANVQVLAKHDEQLATHNTQLAAHKQQIEANQQNIAEHTQKIEQGMAEIEAHTQRFMALTDYDVKGEATVYFGVGSYKISAKGEEELRALAGNATALKGYIVEVMGYTDSTGGARMNTELSEKRARAVVTFLIQQCTVPIRHILAPGAMGEYGAKATNETKAGRAENRRVEVKILVNKGVAGM